MTTADRIARLNSACEAHWGEPVTYHDGSGGTTAVPCVLTNSYDQLGIDTIMREQRWQGLINSVDLALTPAVGDVIETATGARYRVDEPPEDADGLWRLILTAE